MNNLKNKAFLLFTMIGLGLTLHAAPITPPPPPGGGPPGSPIPGIVYALIAAIGYGAYKNYANSKNK
jgi:drug/metabolite transporter (DMT)-like permease